MVGPRDTDTIILFDYKNLPSEFSLQMCVASREAKIVGTNCINLQT